MLLGHTPVGAVEIDSYCQQILRERQSDLSLPEFPIFGDIRTFDAKPWAGKVDIVCGGFPCQPWSVAGKRKGEKDERHLWPEFARVVKECRPKFVFAENVAMSAFKQPWRDLRELGYRVPPILCLSAASVGAPHRRKRWWMLANSDHQGLERRDCSSVQKCAGQQLVGSGSASMGDAKNQRQLQSEGCKSNEWRRIGYPSWWSTEPNVGRVANGVAFRVDRLRALGNGQVPLCAAKAFSILMKNYYL